MAKRSKNIVKRLDPSAHGTCTVCAPCSGQSMTGTDATRTVLNWQLSICRHRRSRHSFTCIRLRHSGQAHRVSGASVKRTSMVSVSAFSCTSLTDHGLVSPRIC